MPEKQNEKKSYRVRVGLDYGKNKRAEPGAVRKDLPASSVQWLLEGGYIEEVSDDDGGAGS